MRVWRLIDSGLPGHPDPPGAALNMAIDRALLHLHAQGLSPPTLRLYRWQPPALSLGRFQARPSLEPGACGRLGLEVVRRPTGGGAVLHLDDLTYAVVAGRRDGLPPAPAPAYRLLSRALLAGLRLLGVEAGPGRRSARGERPEVCFLRAATCDIVHGGRKLVGSAQRWRGSSLLQHGSIAVGPQSEALADLFGADPRVLAGPGGRTTSLAQILGRVPEAGEVARAIRDGMALSLGVAFEPGGLSGQEWALARELAGRGAVGEPEPGRAA